MGTHYPAVSEINREWLVIDLAGLTVGRAASKIATLLRGKHKVTFTPHLDVGDFVVCINADKVVFTGRKLDGQLYRKHTGFVGNLKERSAREVLSKWPELVMRQAVKRMLPKNTLGAATFSKLKVYAGANHPHAAQNPRVYEIK
jgi:large subunit ribosomal protein L13